MKKRISYYVSGKNVLVWLAAILMAGSAALRIAYFCGKGADATTVWLGLYVPVAACLIYALIIIFDGKEHLYRTATAVLLFAVYFFREGLHLTAPAWAKVLWCCGVVGFYILYRLLISGKLRCGWLLIVMHAAALGILAYLYRRPLFEGDFAHKLSILPDLAMIFAGLLTMLAKKPHTDGAYHPTWGDRPDGRRLRTLDPVQVVGNYIMPNRVPASNQMRDTLDISAIERYILEKRKQGYAGFGITHVILAAYVRSVAKYPALNRFLSGQQVYTRDEDIQFCMMVKEEMSIEGAESAMKLHLTPSDTAIDVYTKMKDEVARIKSASDASDFDKVAKALSLIPGVFFKFTIWLLKTLDYFGLLPKFLLEVSPFHGSVFFTSMGSLGIPPITHHLYDFGNLPLFVAFGCKYRKNELEVDGTVVQKKYVDFTVNTDERICDGFYYATAMKYWKRVMLHPEQLDQPPETVVRDIE